MIKTLLITGLLTIAPGAAMAQYDVDAANMEWRMQMLEDQADRLDNRMRMDEYMREPEPLFPEQRMYEPNPYLDFLPADNTVLGPGYR
jgi:hypothetical protein